jgi:STE24 endopeptidase
MGTTRSSASTCGSAEVRLRGFLLLLALLILPLPHPVHAAPDPPGTLERPAPAGASGESTPALDPVAATDAYLARLTPEQRARSDAYFEGGYWLQLWDFLIGLGVAWLLLGTGLSSHSRTLLERWTRRKWLQTLLYSTGYILVAAVLTFPMTVYESFFREHQYQMSNQTFLAWLKEALMALSLGLVFGGIALVILYTVLRRAERTWWIWGALVTFAFSVFVVLIFPVFVAPLFNSYTPLKPSPLREKILSLARANGIPADEVFEVDASRQTKRVSANVSGFLGTLRISLNDNLLKRCSDEEIQQVMGHEMGHYVLNHISEALVFEGVVIVVGFAFLSWAFARVTRGWGARWGIRGIGDVAGLPLIVALFSVYSFALTPLENTFTRANEAEADLFGLNAARQPDGFAEVSLKLGEYRKLSPGPLEEWIFFDHPSGRNRILMAMRWKAEHLKELPPSTTP